MSGKQRNSDAVELLTADQRAIEALFAAFNVLCGDGASLAEKGRAAGVICVALSVQAQIEEEIFYPAMRASANGAAIIDRLEVEHLLAKDLIAQISTMQPGDALYDARVLVLGKVNQYRVGSEERALFPYARRAGLDLTALGNEMRARKQQLLAEYKGMALARLRFDAAGDPVGRRALARREPACGVSNQARVAA